MGDDRAIAYREGERIIIRASSWGNPLRCLVLALMDETPMPAPDYLRKAADAGTAAEGVVKDRLRSMGYTITGEQNEINLEIIPGVFLRGHLDATSCIGPDGVDRILEVKSMSPRVWEKWQAHGFAKFDTYVWQISTYMQGNYPGGSIAMKEATYAVINRETNELDIRTIPAPLIEWEQMVTKAQAVKSLVELDVAPVCDGTALYPCAYDYLCDKRQWEFAELEEGEDDTLLRLVKEYAEWGEQADELESKRKFNRSIISKIMGKRSKVEVPGWSLSVTTPTASPKLNVVRLRERLGDELEKYYDAPDQRDPVLYIRKKG